MSANKNRVTELLEDYARIVNHIHGVYFDAGRGFRLLLKEADAIQRNILRKLPELTIDDLDAQQYIVTDGDPDSVDTTSFHLTTQGTLKERNKESGTNWRFIGNMCVVVIYQFWQDHYRKEIAKSLRVEERQVACDVMGDLRHFRNSIIHNRGVAQEEIKCYEIFKWFNPGDTIFLTREMYTEIAKQISGMRIDVKNDSEHPDQPEHKTSGDGT